MAAPFDHHDNQNSKIHYARHREEFLNAFCTNNDCQAAEIAKVVNLELFTEDFSELHLSPSAEKPMVQTIIALAERGLQVNRPRGYQDLSILELITDREYESDQEESEMAEVARTLMKNGASQYDVRPRDEKCLLYQAIIHSLSELAIAFIENGGPVNWKEDTGRPLVMAAYRLRQPLLLAKLIQGGAHLEFRAYRYQIYLRYALYNEELFQRTQRKPIEPFEEETMAVMNIAYHQVNLAHLARMTIRKILYEVGGKPIRGINNQLTKLPLPTMTINYLSFRHDFDHLTLTPRPRLN